MATLALMEQGVTLAVEGELFRVEREGQLVQQVRMAEVDEVLIFGSITLTPAAIAALLHRGIDTVFLTAAGRYRGRLVGKPGRNVELRLAQLDRFRDPQVALPLARAVVEGKVANQRALLLRAQREQASTLRQAAQGSAQGASSRSAQGTSASLVESKREDLAQAIGGMRRLLEALETAGSVEAARGVEGQAAALYFGVFGRCLRNPDFSFTTRTRRPPRDPVNAMLSFGYTLLGTIMESAVLRAGLDPMIGVFHAPEYGRPSLALDLIEEFRPVVVDTLVLRVINRREVAREDFEELHDEAELAAVGEEEEGDPPPADERAVWLGPSGRKVFFRAWGRRLRETHFYPIRQQTLTLEEIMQQQVYQIARVLRGEETVYRPFVVR
jgi:CRISPR-associated protein Cas1